MFRDDTRSEARGFLENVTGLPFVGYSVSGDLTVVNVAEREAELLASKVLVERPTIMITRESSRCRGQNDHGARITAA